MKRFTVIGAVTLALLWCCVMAFAQPNPQTAAPAGRGAAVPSPAPARSHYWWRDQAPGAGRGAPNPNATKMPLISVKGNRFVDPDGKPVLFRGLSISDPDKLEMQGHWNKDHFVKVQQMGTTLLRIPVHPVAWRERGGVEYIKLLGPSRGMGHGPGHVHHD